MHLKGLVFDAGIWQLCSPNKHGYVRFGKWLEGNLAFVFNTGHQRNFLFPYKCFLMTKPTQKVGDAMNVGLSSLPNSRIVCLNLNLASALKKVVLKSKKISSSFFFFFLSSSSSSSSYFSFSLSSSSSSSCSSLRLLLFLMKSNDVISGGPSGKQNRSSYH